MDKKKKIEMNRANVIAKHTKKKDMTPEQLAFYKRGSKKGRRKSFLIRSAIKCSILAGVAVGGYYGYKWAAEKYSPMVVETTKRVFDITGQYLYNYVYYKSAYSLESGKAEVMAQAIEQMLDKYEELKQQLDDETSQTSEEVPGEVPSGANPSGLYTFPQRSLSVDEKTASANFIVGLYNNGETSKFDIQSFQWSDTFNININTTHQNGEHQVSFALAGAESTMQKGKAVFGTEPVEFNGDLYNKFGVDGIKSAIGLVKNVVGGLETAIQGIGIDGNNVTMEQMTNFFQEEDCFQYLKDAGLDLGVDTDRIEDMINDESGESTENPTEEEPNL